MLCLSIVYTLRASLDPPRSFHFISVYCIFDRLQLHGLFCVEGGIGGCRCFHFRVYCTRYGVCDGGYEWDAVFESIWCDLEVDVGTELGNMTAVLVGGSRKQS